MRREHHKQQRQDAERDGDEGESARAGGAAECSNAKAHRECNPENLKHDCNSEKPVLHRAEPIRQCNNVSVRTESKHASGGTSESQLPRDALSHMRDAAERSA